VLLETLKIVLPFLFGGLAGSLLTEFFRRRNTKIQVIPLIERANRLVSPKLKGFTLARLSGSAESPRLEGIENLREYQLTLRNTSTVHLQGVEIQFEFSTADVEAWAGRPSLSNTAPEIVEAAPADPWKKAHRWRIPHLPSTDSIEFNFRVVNPVSEAYEVALYNSDRVVVEKTKGEPRPPRGLGQEWRSSALFSAFFAAFLALLTGASMFLWPTGSRNVATVGEGGCGLTVISSFDQVSISSWPWTGPWEISHRILNTGVQKCVLESSEFTGASITIPPGQELRRTSYSKSRPKLTPQTIIFDANGAAHTAQVSAYREEHE
jgi:hypothetical protein